MNLVGGIAIYCIIWFLTLFAVLPFGVRTSEEEGSDPVEGAADSAPANPQMGRKVLITTGVAFIIWLIAFVTLEYRLISLDDIPFFPRFGDEAR
ncbi:DUF1467 family protein [Pyruvatibacter mobilis]|jgi:predicted secreted protein|uniref:DUF1467 family protein n=1 Tax=Pyruvatibacter mobilis TaxID=1712261 RepID=A0A845QBI0_9HYPH|nr:DUF1467 family protein [Pyruvatibacter mobilis]NBG95638.1 DUF1467 family protein [Pyruvatibacter mobilis]QJD75292.1 DUF1467 family protein [Pyruvatibacter mobilis]GGD14406.1 membrane protein [Pyruvatibacter mobilis]